MFREISIVVIRKSGKILYMKHKVRQKSLLSYIKSEFEIESWKLFRKYWDVDEKNWLDVNDNICFLDIPFCEKKFVLFVQE